MSDTILTTGPIAQARSDGQGARFGGHVDEVRLGQLQGWAFDKVGPQEPVHVVVVCDDTILTVVRADRERTDVAATVGVGPRCGFFYSIPEASLRGHRSISVLVVDEEVGRQVANACQKRDRDIDAPPIPVHTIAGLQDTYLSEALPWAKTALASLDRIAAAQRQKQEFADVSSEGVCLIEIQDLLTFLRDNNNVTGIQRTVCGLIDALLNSDDKTKLFRFCAVSNQPGHILVFDTVSVYKVVMKVVEGDAIQSEL